VEVNTKFGGAWYRDSPVKEGHKYIQIVCFTYIDREL